MNSGLLGAADTIHQWGHVYFILVKVRFSGVVTKFWKSFDKTDKRSLLIQCTQVMKGDCHSLLGHSSLEHDVIRLPAGIAKKHTKKKNYGLFSLKVKNPTHLPSMCWTMKRTPNTHGINLRSLIMLPQYFHNICFSTSMNTHFTANESFVSPRRQRGATHKALAISLFNSRIT